MKRLSLHLLRAAHLARRGAARRGDVGGQGGAPAGAPGRRWPGQVLRADGAGQRQPDGLCAVGDAGSRLPDPGRAEASAWKPACWPSSKGGSCGYSPMLATAELAVRKLAALEALSRSTRWPAMLESFTVEPNLWPTSAVIDWYLILQRSPKLPQRDAALAQAGQILRARLNLQGTTMGFSTERSDDWWWLMASPTPTPTACCWRWLDNPAWQADMGRLARGALGRQQQGALEHDHRQRLGRAGAGQILAQVRGEPVTGNAAAVLAGQEHRLDRRPVPPRCCRPGRRRGELNAAPRRQRQAVGHGAEPGRRAAQGAAVERLPHRRTITPVEQKTKGAVVARRRLPRAPRPRSAGRHDLGRGGRSDSGQRQRSSAPAWARFADRHGGERAAGYGPPSRSAPSGLPRLLRVRPEREAGASSTRCG
jgi:hypothetical protein